MLVGQVACKRGAGASGMNGIGDPLRILFFGSDLFSVHSLRALTGLQDGFSCADGGPIESLQVVSRPPKWGGKAHSVLRTPPILQELAHGGQRALLCDSGSELRDTLLPLIEGPPHYNMLVCVSFGLLIPRELVSKAQYSLNVHPSLLPRYRGSAPIQHALVNQDATTGVTVQTLHPDRFDRGQILAQSPEIDIAQCLRRHSDVRQQSPSSSSSCPSPSLCPSPSPSPSPSSSIRWARNSAILVDQLGRVGAELLKDVIVQGKYKHEPCGSESGATALGSSSTPTSTLRRYDASVAPKIRTQDKLIHWDTQTAGYLENKLLALGPLHTFIQSGSAASVNAHSSKTKPQKKRVLLYEISKHHCKSNGNAKNTTAQPLAPGQFYYDAHDDCVRVGCATADTQLRVHTLQLEGYQREAARTFMQRLPKRCGTAAAAAAANHTDPHQFL